MSNTGNECQPIAKLDIRGMVNAGIYAALLTLGNTCMGRHWSSQRTTNRNFRKKPFFSLTKAVVPTSPFPFAPCGEGHKENQRGTQMEKL